jgi:hypothetical protein
MWRVGVGQKCSERWQNTANDKPDKREKTHAKKARRDVMTSKEKTKQTT